MAVHNNKLFKPLIDRKMTAAEPAAEAGFNANTNPRLKKGQAVSLDSTEKICFALQCGADDILEFLPSEKESDNAE